MLCVFATNNYWLRIINGNTCIESLLNWPYAFRSFSWGIPYYSQILLLEKVGFPLVKINVFNVSNTKRTVNEALAVIGCSPRKIAKCIYKAYLDGLSYIFVNKANNCETKQQFENYILTFNVQWNSSLLQIGIKDDICFIIYYNSVSAHLVLGNVLYIIDNA